MKSLFVTAPESCFVTSSSGWFFFILNAFSMVRFVMVIDEGLTAFDSINASVSMVPMFPVPINPIFKRSPSLDA